MSNPLEKIQARFDKIVGDGDSFTATILNDSSQKFPERLKKIHAQLSTITGGKYFLTPPIVEIARDHKCEIYFAYKISRQKKILRPYLKLVTDFDSGLILEFKNARYSEFADAEKFPLNAEFDAAVPVARTTAEQLALLEDLQALYIKIRAFAFEKDLSAEDKQTLSSYAECLAKTVPPDLLNFCKSTEPKFFDWLAETV